tara:strand:- start:5686 stop:6225 length:540 start_codon:yes stop_codon:yes gene_type:complete
MFSESFELAWKKTKKHEGGYVNDKDDSGGATNWGISLRFVKAEGIELDLDGDGDIDKEDMKALKEVKAKEIYHKYFWERGNYDQIDNIDVAGKLFDMAVNMGARQAHKLAQRACHDCGNIYLQADGILGTKSRGAINGIDTEKYLTKLRKRHAGFYEQIAEKNPKLKKFLKGWLKRAEQ